MAALLQREWGNQSSAFKKADKFPSAASLQGHELNFMPELAFCVQVANICTRWLSQDGEREDFSKNLRASLFNVDLSNEPNFSQIHLAGQYLLSD
jgi:hypothetical protein